jgi:hypothetical protein
MSTIYRKSLKGIDEVAFKSSGLPMRLSSYLLIVDGETNVDQLAARNPQLPSLAMVLQGLQEQGFIEVAHVDASRNVVDMQGMRVANGAPMQAAQYQQPAQQSYQAPQQQYAPQPQYAPAPQQQAYFPELDTIKTQMTREIMVILGADAGPVVSKIQACRSKDDLFTAMMGIKKIITMYSDRPAADKFANRYAILST